MWFRIVKKRDHYRLELKRDIFPGWKHLWTYPSELAARQELDFIQAKLKARAVGPDVVYERLFDSKGEPIYER